MSEKPIIFSGDMVRAILDGNKTMTRRVIKPQPESISDAKKPKYDINDILWVRETFRYKDSTKRGKVDVRYKADGDIQRDKWKPSIFMPKWASRIKLKVTDVKVQRVQDISDEDAIAEGICRLKDDSTSIHIYKDYRNGNSGVYIAPRRSFMSLWNSIHEINAKRWESNPFVFVYTFEVIGNKANGTE